MLRDEQLEEFEQKAHCLLACTEKLDDGMEPEALALVAEVKRLGTAIREALEELEATPCIKSDARLLCRAIDILSKALGEEVAVC